MKLYSGIGPSARTVRMFLAEKGLIIPTVELDLLRLEHLSETNTALIPGGQLPVLELDDGTVIAESLAICEYIEELYAEPSLVGATAAERAQCRMWCRRIDLRIMEPAIQGFKASEGFEFFKDRYYLVRSGAEELKALSRSNLEWLEELMMGKSFICGDRFTLADIQLWCFLDHQRAGGPALSERCPLLSEWFATVAQRESTKSSAS